jgi:amino acid transporter
VLIIAVIGQLFCGMSCMTSASRMMYAFSRDGAVPGWRIWSRVNERRIPFNAVMIVALIAMIITLPALKGNKDGVTVAFTAVVSIGVIGLYIAYAIPIFLRLRIGDAWEPGEWNLGRHYKWIGTIACLWVAFISVLFILPVTPTGIPWNDGFTWLSVNYAPIAVLGTLALVGGWWLVSARHWFEGPIAQGTPEELARIEARYGETGAAGPATSGA